MSPSDHPRKEWPRGRVDVKALTDSPLYPAVQALVAELERLMGPPEHAELGSWVTERAILHALENIAVGAERGPSQPPECRNSPTRMHAFSEHEGARTKRGTGKACVWCGKHELTVGEAAGVPSQLDADEAAALVRGLADVKAGRIKSLESIDAELRRNEHTRGTVKE